jgi:hypothetical protein
MNRMKLKAGTMLLRQLTVHAVMYVGRFRRSMLEAQAQGAQAQRHRGTPHANGMMKSVRESSSVHFKAHLNQPTNLQKVHIQKSTNSNGRMCHLQ